MMLAIRKLWIAQDALELARAAAGPRSAAWQRTVDGRRPLLALPSGPRPILKAYGVARKPLPFSTFLYSISSFPLSYGFPYISSTLHYTRSPFS